MRLEPIDAPRGLLLRIAYWMSRRRLGAVMTPLKVIYARVPKLAGLAYRMSNVVEKGLSLDEELVLLVTTQSSLINDCAFCADLHFAQAVQARLGLEKFRALPDFATSPHFDARERAALAFTDEVTRTRGASDASFEALREHFDERQIVELTWLNAVGNYFNLMAVPLGIESDGLMELAMRRAA